MNKQENILLTEITNQLRTIEGRVQRIEVGVYGSKDNDIEGLIDMNRTHQNDIKAINAEINRIDKRLSIIESIKSFVMWLVGGGVLFSLIFIFKERFL